MILLVSAVSFALLCALAAPAGAQNSPVKVSIGTETLDLGGQAVRIGDELYAPLTILDRLAGGYALSGNSKKAIFNNRMGEANSVELKNVNGTMMAPVGKSLSILGGDMVWDAGKTSVNLFAHVKSVEFADGELTVNCSFPVKYSMRVLGNRLVVDIDGAKLKGGTKEIAVQSDSVEKCRWAQFNPNTARVVMVLKKTVRYKAQSEPIASRIVVLVGESIAGATPTPTVTPTVTPTPTPTPTPSPTPTPTPTPARVKPYDVESVVLQSVDELSFDLFIFTSGPPSAKAYSDLSTGKIGIALQGGTLTEDAQKIEGSHPLLLKYTCNQESDSPPSARLTLELPRMSLIKSQVEGNSVTIHVRPLYKSGGTLKGKLVVIDPGHMGTNGGAQFGKVYERDINLAISRALADALRAAGAEAMLTRDDKTDVDFKERSGMAMDNQADFFISIHCNSNFDPNSASGTETYYHKQDPSAKALAFNVHNAVCASAGMCDRRPKSDLKRFAIGMAVLRNLDGSGIPGILLECGFINHTADRKKLTDPGFQKKIANGIVRGLKDYLVSAPTEMGSR